MIAMTPEMSEQLDSALADGTPCLLGTATKDGAPQISPKGSVAVFDPQTLSIWERALRSALRRIEENPQVVVYYRNSAKPGRPTYRFHGRARIADDAALRERVWERTIQREKDSDPEKKGVAVLIDVELIEDLNGRVIMQRD
jgi:predicted pyridoxine 5'-phosphate oxidase superfamily flavin-nucleotide-binding protein